MVFLFSIILACGVWLADAGAFLHSTLAEPSNHVDKQDVKQSLLLELRDPRGVKRLHTIEAHMLPIYTALPKGQHGKLEPATVSYALHRYFVEKHGWYMNGFEPKNAGSNSSVTIMKDRAPHYIQSLFDEHSHGQGLGLRELTIFASLLTDLVHKEAAGALHDVFVAMELPRVGPVHRQDWERAIKAYIVQHLLGRSVMANLTERSMGEAAVERFLLKAYPPWKDTYMYVQDCHVADDLAQQFHRNPFVQGQQTFDDAARFVQEFGHNFGSFQNLECKMMKNQLLELEHQGTGRVQLAHFYARGMEGKFAFREHAEYLRHLGVLDETDPDKPSVVISNYLTSASNCVTSSGFYSVCCVNECEGLMRHLEREIAAPSAPPSRIIELVAGLSSETVDAPRNLSTALVTRMDDIAKQHGGRVPLYGRLFSQWMHHAYPRECPFPQFGVAAKPMVPEQWLNSYGTVVATREEMLQHAQAEVNQSGISEVPVEPIPWSDEEELLSSDFDDVDSQSPGWYSGVSVRMIVACMLLVSFAASLARSSAVGKSEQSGAKVEKCMV